MSDSLPPEGQAAKARLRYRGLPLVAIVGRPNVGKSTLFNRLLRRRKAIVDPTPGVTRDPIEETCVLPFGDKAFSLVDTGGYKLEREALDDAVAERALRSLARADLVLFVLDAVSITPEDEEFASILRKSGKKALLVVNKADSPERDSLVWNHARFGFEGPVFVSAEHGRNMDELEEAIAARLDFSAVEVYEDEHEDVRIAIMGKPNTGKSTLLNRLLGEEKSIVSEIPGTTRDVVSGRFSHRGRQFTVMDTAGIRRKGKVLEAVEYYSVNRAIKAIDECDVVILMIDAQEGLTDQDKKIAALAVDQGRGVILALNKWDAMPDIKNGLEAVTDKIRYFFGQMAFAPILPLSAKEGTGIGKVLDTAAGLFEQLTLRVETSRLNKAVEQWVEERPLPVGTRTRFKLRYATQTGVNPLSFVFFVTRPDAVTEAYRSYLKNKIRSELGYANVPVTLELKGSRLAFGSAAMDEHRARKRRLEREAALASSTETKAERKAAAAETKAKEKAKAAKKPAKKPAFAVKPAAKKALQKPDARRAEAKRQASRRRLSKKEAASAEGASRAASGAARRLAAKQGEAGVTKPGAARPGTARPQAKARGRKAPGRGAPGRKGPSRED